MDTETTRSQPKRLKMAEEDAVRWGGPRRRLAVRLYVWRGIWATAASLVGKVAVRTYYSWNSY